MKLKAPQRTCAGPGCAQLITEGARCPACAAQSQRAAETQRGSSWRRGYDVVWQRVRTLYIRWHPECEDCLEAGLVGIPTTQVHHLVKVRDRPDLRLELSNLRGLCDACHSRRTGRGE